MTVDAWLPVGHTLPDGERAGVGLYEGPGWQILGTQANGRALLVHEDLANRWIASGLLAHGAMSHFDFGQLSLSCISSGEGHVTAPVAESRSPDTKSDALAFAVALKATREIDRDTPLHDALYVEKLSRLLPTYSISSRADDDVVLGYWLTGGATVSVKSFRRLQQTMSWLGSTHLRDVVEAAGFEVNELVPGERRIPKSAPRVRSPAADAAVQQPSRVFELPGRPSLASFINEHVVEVLQNRERYKALGIGFPPAVVLHGPPGCGKTFAAERLVDFLGWPSFQIDASSVASPYIHETSKKVAEVFDAASQSAPSILIIDEMEAFLADREMGAGHHRVEEVAEFLRRIPEATKNEVLILAMTNRIDMIDPAILRRGRFDHIITVDYASETEVLSLLRKLLATLPVEAEVDVVPLAKALAQRPLSDVAFVVREGARLAARAGKDRLDQHSLMTAMLAAPMRDVSSESVRRVGFI